MKVFGLLDHMLPTCLMQTKLHAEKNRSQQRGKLLTDADNVKSSSLVTCTLVSNAVLSIRADSTQLALD